ncbi:GNAT family N-acetyltransferase [Pedobacter steynii]|uniref:N-acetyltransferase domain-containing protein n=1 Tax=Pedobacter steynii TaxID=430522 RepID=A0A1D7QII2_9SPHI|nr:GNAT family N-acetyltransferase [Pedobacter steynii]AOM78484.1 hypothetical protein BFS30_15640 [Pedobacter steynii]
MGKLINGLFGGFHGRIGNLVGYTLKGKHIIRKIGISTKPLTPARKANCQKMKVVNEILSPSLPVIRAGFRLAIVGTDKSEYNEAVSYNKLNALQGEYPNISLDYTKVLVSMGDLPMAVNPAISQNADGNEIEFNWEIPADLSYQYDNDRAMLMIYFPALKVSCYHLIGSKRAEGKDTIRIDGAHAGERMEAYISFIKDDGKQVSNSVYAGSLNAGKATESTVETAPKTATPILDFSFSGPDFEIIDVPNQELSSAKGWNQYFLKNKASDEIIGDFTFKLRQNNQYIAEIEINISPVEQRKGDTKEAASALMSFLFEKAKVNRIVKTVNAKDEAAIALLRSLGFSEEGYFVENAFIDGKWINQYQFAMLKSEWDLFK